MRKIGTLTVSEVGMSCMAFSHDYGKIPAEPYRIEAIQNAQRHGCTFFDTAEAAKLLRAKHNIPYHVTARNDVFFGRALAEQFDAENCLVLEVVETLLIE